MPSGRGRTRNVPRGRKAAARRGRSSPFQSGPVGDARNRETRSRAKAPSSKSQAPKKPQAPNPKGGGSVPFFELGISNFFGVWSLEFGIWSFPALTPRGFWKNKRR